MRGDYVGGLQEVTEEKPVFENLIDFPSGTAQSGLYG
jgi:hypothetical protein